MLLMGNFQKSSGIKVSVLSLGP